MYCPPRTFAGKISDQLICLHIRANHVGKIYMLQTCCVMAGDPHEQTHSWNKETYQGFHFSSSYIKVSLHEHVVTDAYTVLRNTSVSSESLGLV